mgnify:CR=1 FL=1
MNILRKRLYFAPLFVAVIALAGSLLWPVGSVAREEDHAHDEYEEVDVESGETVDHAQTTPDQDPHDHPDASGTGHDRDEDHAPPEEEGHEGHGHDDQSPVVKLDQATIEEFGIEVARAEPGKIDRIITLPGELVFNADRIAHVTPTVPGIVEKVNFSVGDRVEAGDVMAVLNSRELAAARSKYLAAQARLALAEENLERDRRLFEDKVGTERAVLESRRAFKEAQINVNQAENTLHALGYSHEQIREVDKLEEGTFNVYELRAPLSGIVTDRHLTTGEVVEPSANGSPFTVADLSKVWVNLTVYQRDLSHVQKGQRVMLEFGHGIPDADGRISFVSPSLDEHTRTATARIVLENPDGHWRPGLFLNGRVLLEEVRGRIVVPQSAVQTVDERPVVFLRKETGFMPRPVTLGNRGRDRVEVKKGLKPGERYAATNTFVLKSELNRTALEHAGHNH